MKKPASKSARKPAARSEPSAKAVAKRKVVKAATRTVASAVASAAKKKTTPARRAATVKKTAAPKKAAAPKKIAAPAKAVAAKKPAPKRRAAPVRAAGLLPPAFAALEPFVEMWALPGSDARFRQRLNSTPAQRQAFYNALAPRGGEALSYLDSKPYDPDRMSDPDRNLLRLMLALAEVSLTEEVNGQAVEAIHAQSNRLMNFTKEIDSI